MTISGYSRVIVDTMLGWLKGLANWVLRLFNLAGSSPVNPLLWLSQNWLRLLILLLIIGVAADILVWLVRWRPHWVWFGKERVIVDDERFFDESNIREKLDPFDDGLLEKNWQERDYVVSSALVNRPRKRSGDRDAAQPDVKSGGSFRRGERRAKAGDARAKQARKAGKARREHKSDFFGMDGSRPDVTDFYEDEVFNVNNLPNAGDYSPEDEKQKKV